MRSVKRRVYRIAAIAMVSCAMGPVFARHSIPPIYELYSWQETDGGWSFSLLPDTDRQKTIEEVFHPGKALRGLARLERKIATLPRGSQLVWFDRLTIGGVRVQGSDRLKYPREDTVAKVRLSARARDIEVSGPP